MYPFKGLIRRTEFKVFLGVKLSVPKSSLRLMTLALLLILVTGCSSMSSKPVDASPLDDVELKFTSGTCEYLNFDKTQTLCKLKLRVRNKGQEPVSINGKFRFSISTYDFQVRYAQYKEFENEGYKTINAPEVLGLYDGVVGTSTTRIDYEISPLETYKVTVAVIVPTKTVINGVKIEIDKNSEFASDSIRILFLNICTYGEKSAADSKFMQRGFLCEEGKAVSIYDK